jgi:YVTN family beta-propeller protein
MEARSVRAVRGSQTARRVRLVALSGVVGLLGFVPEAAGSPSQTTVLLPLSGYFEMVVDPSHQHVFVTGDPSANSRVVVVDYAGNVVKVVRGETGAAGMALDSAHSTLYVALQAADAIAVIDTGTLEETARFSVGAEAGCPGYATFIESRVWFGFTCGSSPNTVGIGSLDPATGEVRTFGGRNYPRQQPIVRSTPVLIDTLFASVHYPGTGDTIFKYRINIDGSLSFLASTETGGQYIYDLKVTTDGLDVLASGCVKEYFIPAFRTSDLSRDVLYDNGCPAWAIAVTNDGTVVATVEFDCGQSNVFMHHRDSKGIYKNIAIGIPPVFIYYGAAAFNEDASLLFTVGEEYAHEAYFTIFPNPTSGTNAWRPRATA